MKDRDKEIRKLLENIIDTKHIKDYISAMDGDITELEAAQRYAEEIKSLLSEDESCGTCRGKGEIEKEHTGLSMTSTGKMSGTPCKWKEPCPDCQKPHIPNAETEATGA